MGNLLSAETFHANAYLTAKGRDYLFNNENNRFVTIGGNIVDLMKITKFSLSDPDANYNVDASHSILDMGNGNIPDISGKNEDCIKSTVLTQEQNLISYDGVLPGGGGGLIAIEYETQLPGDTANINIENLSL